MPEQERLLAADVGKTRTRLALFVDGARVSEAAVPGVRGLGHDADAEQLADALTQAAAQLDPALLAGVRAIGVGAAGALMNPAVARRAAVRVASALGVPTLLTSDLVTAHAGATGAGSGVVLIAGTGAVALGVNPVTGRRVVDGWGPALGDLGSGGWIGREGLRAVLAAGAGLAPATALADCLAELDVSADRLPGWVAASENPARAMARFAPVVIRLARQGDDPVATGIVESAVSHLARTARAAAGSEPADVISLGGLTNDPWFAARLDLTLQGLGLTPIPARGDALDGARLVASRKPTLYQDWIHHAE